MAEKTLGAEEFAAKVAKLRQEYTATQESSHFEDVPDPYRTYKALLELVEDVDKRLRAMAAAAQ